MSVIQTKVLTHDDLISLKPIPGVHDSKPSGNYEDSQADILITRPHSIEIQTITVGSSTPLESPKTRLKLTSLEMITSVDCFRISSSPSDVPGLVIGVLTETNSIKLIHIDNSSASDGIQYTHTMLQTVKLPESIGNLAIQPSTFGISAKGNISVYTKEGLLVSLCLKKSRSNQNNGHDWWPIIERHKSGKWKGDIYEINTFTLANINPSNRAPLKLNQISSRDENPSTSYDVLFTPNMEQYCVYASYKLNKHGYLKLTAHHQFPEDESGSISMISWRYGVICVSDKTLYVNFQSSDKDVVLQLDSVVGKTMGNFEISQVKKGRILKIQPLHISQKWGHRVKLLLLRESDRETTFLVLDSCSRGKPYYRFTIKHSLKYPSGDEEQVPILSIKDIASLPITLPTLNETPIQIESVFKLTNAGLILAYSSTLDRLLLIPISSTPDSPRMLQIIPLIPDKSATLPDNNTGPILDMNITESFIPRLQISSCADPKDTRVGYLKNICQGFKHDIITYSGELGEEEKDLMLQGVGILDYWVIFAGEAEEEEKIIMYLVLATINGTVILCNEPPLSTCWVRLDTEWIKGDVLDVMRYCQEDDGSTGLDLILATTQGLYTLNRGVLLRDIDICKAKLLKTQVDCLVYVNAFHELYCGERRISGLNQSEVCCMDSVKVGEDILTVVGHWDGTAHIVRHGRGSNTGPVVLKVEGVCEKGTMHSVLIKRIAKEDTLLILVGDIHGSVTVLNARGSLIENLGMVCSGNRPVNLSSIEGDHVLCHDLEMSVILEFNSVGGILDRGYLDLPLQQQLNLKVCQSKIFLLNEHSKQLSHVSVDLTTSQPQLTATATGSKEIIRKSISFTNHQHFTLLLTQSTSDVKPGKIQCSLKVISTISGHKINEFKLRQGVEITDCINMTHCSNRVLNTTIKPNASASTGAVFIQLHNVLSQTFLVSVIDHDIDPSMTGKPCLKVFTIDEDGVISHQNDYVERGDEDQDCEENRTTTEQIGKFMKLINLGESYILAVGDVIGMFRLVYDVGCSQFSMKRCSEFTSTRYFSSCVKLLSDDSVLVGDVIYGVSLLKVNRCSAASNQFEFQLRWCSQFRIPSATAKMTQMLTQLETVGPVVITCDMMNNLSVWLAHVGSDAAYELECVTLVNLKLRFGEVVNVIRGVNSSHSKLTEWLNNSQTPQVIPLALLGTSQGSIFKLSLMTDASKIELLNAATEKSITDYKSQSSNIDNDDVSWNSLRGVKSKGQTGNLEDVVGFIDGDLILKNCENDSELTELITSCSQLYNL
ncbi:hypothetical protein WICPIJ_001548 [Wickerhamomyces pijperi]|uniref:Uncharacterized protein n=1 Tax=Wickerhamomyces pijperi TaxID=599730 RepID=A0A9P8TPR6_WICPI|nr:hypothetical protein WICPIJ_001548 [Wickerhamomyces pijperi]